MKVDVRFNVEGDDWSNIKISGPDIICKPILKYLLAKLIDNDQLFDIKYAQKEPET